MFELLVPAEKAQLDQVNGDKKAYDLEMRPAIDGGSDPGTPGGQCRAGRVED